MGVGAVVSFGLLKLKHRGEWYREKSSDVPFLERYYVFYSCYYFRCLHVNVSFFICGNFLFVTVFTATTKMKCAKSICVFDLQEITERICSVTIPAFIVWKIILA